MKTYNLQYESFKQLQEFIRQVGLDSQAQQILIQVFTALSERKKIAMLCSQIKKLLPGARIIGTTTSGEIIGRKIAHRSTVISISVFETTGIATALFETANGAADSFQVGVKLARTLISDASKVLILFSDGIHTNGEEILKGIDSVNHQIIVAGGRAADYGFMNETLIFTEAGIINSGVVGAVLNNNKLHVQNFQSLCWEPIGKKMEITRVIGDRVYTVDHIMIREIYKKYLGKEVADHLPKSATEFPFVLNRDGLKIARVAFGANYDDGIRFIGNLYSGEAVHFSYGNYIELLKRLKEITSQIIARPVESIFIYSCTARKVFLQNRITDEVGTFSQIAPTSGFFSYGEFYHFNNKNQLLNLSTTILVLAENESYQKLPEGFKLTKQLENFVDNKQELIINAFTHLTNTVTLELDQINRNLLIKNNEYKQLLLNFNKKHQDLQNSNKKLREHQNMMIQMERIKTLGQLIGGIAHNLKTPLMTSSGGILKLQQNTARLETLLEDLPAARADEVRQILDDTVKWQENIKKYLIYMSDVINTVKGQAKYNSSNNWFTLTELIDKIKLLLEHEIKRRNSTIEYNVKISPETPVKGDINHLIQVLNNIIINAVESYNEKGGKVELNIKVQGSYIEFDIKDSGKGMPKNISRKIFKEMVTTKGKNGSGLGLYISYLIIRTQFLGDIYFKDNPDKGTTFYVLIPNYTVKRSVTTHGDEEDHYLG